LKPTRGAQAEGIPKIKKQIIGLSNQTGFPRPFTLLMTAWGVNDDVSKDYRLQSCNKAMALDDLQRGNVPDAKRGHRARARLSTLVLHAEEGT
jgi:hypothetical protein